MKLPDEVGLAVLSEPWVRAKAGGGALGQTRPTFPGSSEAFPMLRPRIGTMTPVVEHRFPARRVDPTDLRRVGDRRSSSLKCRLIAAAAYLALIISAFGEPDPDGKQEIILLKGRTMGTTYSIKYLPVPAAPPKQQLQRSIERNLDRIEQQMSTYRPDSELSRFNRHPDTNWFSVSTNFAEVVVEAQHISQITGGALDVTVGPLVDLWGFGPQRHTGTVPNAAAIAATRRNVGYQRLEARLSPPALRKAASAIRIDLSGIAKGYAVDAIARHLDALGIRNYLVAVGGELRASGVDANGHAWRVGIERPDPTTVQIQAVVPLANRAISTSGGYRNFFDAGGRSYGHIIDPRTGRPPNHALASVTVVHESNTHADALATALLVLGPDEGFELANRNHLACLFILHADKGFAERRTKAFDRLSSPRPAGKPE